MKEYPSILGPNKAPNLPCLAFYKYDGSNLRFEWHRKRGWSKFGTRTRLFNEQDPDFGSAIALFLNKYSEAIERKLRDNKDFRGIQEAIAFCEFYGPHSFAGQHDARILGVESNEPKQLKLFDINIHKKGLLGPREFVKVFGDLDIAEVIYEGNFNSQFIEDIKQGKYPVKEGVIAKGGSGHTLWMRKVKTLAYLHELKTRFADWQKYWE